VSIQSTTSSTSDSTSALSQGIISSTGIGSGLDVATILSKLMAVDSQPLTLLQNQQTSFNTKLSAYGSLSSALSTFQSSLNQLSSVATFDALSTSSSNSAIATASAGTIATPGSYALNVTQLAQAQSITTSGQASETNAIGTGASTSISFQFGSVSGTAANGTYPSGTTFTPDTTQAIGSVTINSSNNSLQGITTAINAANIGVQASIVGDGSATPYHLVLTSTNSGANSNMQITVTGDSALSNLLSYSPAGTQKLTQTTAGQNANLTVNGIAVTSSSNTVTNSVQGISFNALATGSATINVTSNASGVTSDINSFVSAYNTLNTSLSQMTSYNATTQVAGPFLGDPTVESLKNQIAGIFNGSVNGLGGSQGGLINLAQIGVALQTNGTLSVNSSQLQAALSSNFKGVSALFSSTGNASDSLTSFITATSKTQAGNYAINVTNAATNGLLVGTLNLNAAPTTILANTALNVSVDGTTALVNLAAGTYTASQLATLVESSINNNSTFSADGLGVTTSIDSNGFLNIQSNSFGSSSNVSLSDLSGTGAASLTGAKSVGTKGTDIAGTINGLPAVGSGQYLTGASGSAVDGLEIQVQGATTGARGTVSYSAGYAFQLNNLINSYLTPSTGILANATKGINTEITNLQSQETTMQAQINAEQAQYQAEFTTLDTVVSNLKNTSSFLTSQLSNLNGSANGA